MSNAPRQSTGLINRLWRSVSAADVDSDPLLVQIGTEQVREAARGISRTSVPVIVLALTIGISFQGSANNGVIDFFMTMQVLLAICAQLFLPYSRFTRVQYHSVKAQFRAVMCYTGLISIGWGCLFISAAYTADTPSQTMLLCVHVGVISVGGLTFAMIPRASLLYIFNLTILCLAHIYVHHDSMSGFLYAAIILFALMLSQAYIQMAGQFAARMRSDAERLDTERRMAEAEKREIERTSAAELTARSQRDQDRERAQREKEIAMVALASRSPSP